ncbi:DNA adenine methylase [Helicobacter pylori]|uniref:DNA adenine methylase n=1 Tax=Helicobacter pylori TaxID=210 RepID=UPI000992EF12|nr:DNA adenine methylase [Helicobacter pylori]MBM0598059.1 DNA adenine methylase [Helicobacter pylori]MBS3011475.1 DNA adenine methylase [Helicobacter pylori]MBS3013561.1 DNA adenine methylase [Helicobacter pylori]MDO7816316.1 DNA adenine methylase [Helicobacter pylori]MDO7826641.1 DNA adenine methylase [Helicobacter pylori]
MNYIGSKYKLIPFIKENIHAVVGNDLSGAIFCDLFAGTGIVGRAFKKAVNKVISNDLEYYSFVLNQNYIGNIQEIHNQEELIDRLNSVALKKGFIYSHYSLGGSSRQYFSETNAQKIDAMRLKIEELKLSQNIDNCAYYFLLASLLESADKVANTASVYGAFLKRLKKSAQKELILKGAHFDVSLNANEVYQQDASELIGKISGDILYLDPPYNARQYGANYHLLNTIAAYTPFAPKGKTGLPSYQKSSFCSRSQILNAFENLIKKARFKYIFLSYNNEGLMSETEIKNILKKYGAYSLITKTYMRFKADNKRAHKAAHTKECLHILIK